MQMYVFFHETLFGQQLIFIKIWFCGLTWLGIEIFVGVIPAPRGFKRLDAKAKINLNMYVITWLIHI